MDGNRIRKKMTGGSDAASVLYPINGVREATKRRGGKPKDHAKENVLNMRRKAEQRKKVEEEKQASKQKSLFKMKKFERVGSRVNVAEADSNTPKHEFLRRQSRSSISSASPRSPPSPESPRERRVLSKPPVPRPHEYAQLAPKVSKNFVSENRKEAISRPPSRGSASEKPTDASPRRHRAGEVPSYLLERKEQWAAEEEAKIKAAGDPDCPPGMVVMPDSERLSTLEVLQNSREEAQKTLFRMPLVVETPSQKRRKAELENKLKEIDDAIKIFSRPKVFVQPDK